MYKQSEKQIGRLLEEAKYQTARRLLLNSGDVLRIVKIGNVGEEERRGYTCHASVTSKRSQAGQGRSSP